MPDFIDFLPLVRRSVDDIRASLDADANAGLAPGDPRWVDTVPGGQFYDLTQAPALEIARQWDFLGSEVPAAALLPYAFGDYLDDWGEALGLPRKDEVAATGTVRFSGAEGSAIATGVQVAVPQTDPDADPTTFETTAAGTIPAALANPASLGGTVHNTGGSLAGGVLYYRTTAVDDEGGETAVSNEVVATIPATLPAPGGLAATASDTGGALAAGTYYYRVTALNAAGETVGSAEVSGTIGTGVTTGSVALTWGAVDGATSYRVYRGGTAGGQDTYYASTGASFTDTGAAGTAGTVPATSTATVTTGRVELTWGAVTGAVRYRVYRGTAAGAGTLLAEPTAASYSDTGAATPGTATPPATNQTGGRRSLAVRALDAGAVGNVPAGAISLLLSPVAGVTAVTNVAGTLGGADVETDDAYRDRLLLELSGTQGSGTVTDYQRWALAHPGVGFVTVEPVWNGAGTVRVVITDPENDPCPTSTVDGLQALLDPVAGEGRGQAPIGHTVTVATVSSVAIAVAATVTHRDGYSLDGGATSVATRAAIEAALAAYIEGLAPGEDVILNRVESLFFSVEGVYNVAGVTLNGTAADVVIGGLQVSALTLPATLA